MPDKLIPNSVFFETNSYEEFQSIFIKYFESYQCFSFNKNLLKFIAEKNYFRIFEFLFKNGFLFESEKDGSTCVDLLTFFYYTYSSNDYSKYFKYDTLSYITGYNNIVTHQHLPKIINNQFDWSDSDILLQKYIIFQTIKNSFFAEQFENFLVEKIKYNTQLLNSIPYFIELNNKYNSRFIKKILDNNLLVLNIENKIFIFKDKEYFTDIVKDIIDDPKNFKFICTGLKKICIHFDYIPTHIFDYIMNNNNDLDLIFKLNHISFTEGCLLIKTKYSTYDYSIVSSYLSSILNSKYLPELISKRYFIFNKEFVNRTINQEQIQSIFDDHFELLIQHAHNFSDKLDHLHEKFKLALMIHDF